MKLDLCFVVSVYAFIPCRAPVDGTYVTFFSTCSSSELLNRLRTYTEKSLRRKKVRTSLSPIKMSLRLGKKHLELAGRWAPSAITYGTTAALGVLYFSDWKVIVRYIPFYGGKFNE